MHAENQALLQATSQDDQAMMITHSFHAFQTALVSAF